MSWVKQVTQKPVVGVGRFTSPDTMLRQVKDGILDLVGAARPSIADPFLPNKIREGRLDDIRECIGCNLCYAADFQGLPIRCTQNPAMGEEWRRGWHPEYIPSAVSQKTVLVVGGGPAGLEAARALGQRGYAVTLAEQTRELGGRVLREANLPGLAEWSRVRDWRIGQIEKLDNVEVYLESETGVGEILEFGADRVVLATGSDWRRDGVGRRNDVPVAGWQTAPVLTPDDIMDGRLPTGPVLVFDDDHYYMGGVLAEALAAAGREVTLVTPMYLVSAWTDNTAERERIHARLSGLGVRIETNANVVELAGEKAVLGCVFTGETRSLEVAGVVMVTARQARDRLYHELVDRIDITRIGDCLAPGTIAACVRSGHKYAREMDVDGEVRARRETPARPERLTARGPASSSQTSDRRNRAMSGEGAREARVVVIGGGVAGCSLLYHLTKLGWSDVLLVEKDELTSGSTWHSAGLCTHFNASYNMMKLLRDSVDLYDTLEAETGQSVDLHRCGSVRLACSQDRLDEFEHRKGIAELLGVPFEIVSPERIRELFPLVDTHDVLAAAHLPTDGYIEPDRTHACACEGSGREGRDDPPSHGCDRDRAGAWRLADRDHQGRDPRGGRRERRRAMGAPDRPASSAWIFRSCPSSITTC